MATTKKTTADGQPQSSKRTIAADPLDLSMRLYKQLGKLLDQLEEQDVLGDGVTVPQRISALIAVGRLQKIFQDLRKGDFNVGAGSAIERYSAAFQTADDSRRREPYPRSSTVVQFDTGRAEDDGEYDDDRDLDA